LHSWLDLATMLNGENQSLEQFRALDRQIFIADDLLPAI